MKASRIVVLTVIALVLGFVLVARALESKGGLMPGHVAGLLLLLMIPVRTTRGDGIRLYSALLYRVVSRPEQEGGRRVRTVQFYPKNFTPFQP